MVEIISPGIEAIATTLTTIIYFILVLVFTFGFFYIQYILIRIYTWIFKNVYPISVMIFERFIAIRKNKGKAYKGNL